jgi:NUMOD3 motif
MNIYCTYLTTYRGNKLPPFYIGYCLTKRIVKGYNGSVASRNYKAIWQSERKVNPHLFKTTILTTHSFKAEAMEREQAFQRHLNVIQNPLYINRSIFPQRDVSGSKLSIQTRYKMSLAHKGKKLTDKHKQNISIANKGQIPWNKGKSWQKSDQARQAMKGIPKSFEHRQKISQSLKDYHNSY